MHQCWYLQLSMSQQMHEGRGNTLRARKTPSIQGSKLTAINPYPSIQGSKLTDTTPSLSGLA